jgi:hypothetical protein
MLKKLIKGAQKLVGDILPGDSEKYLGTIVGLATGNPLLAAGAGYLGGGTSGAISGGLSGIMSPGLQGLGGGLLKGQSGSLLGSLTGAGKAQAQGIGELFLGRVADQSNITGARPAVEGILGTGGFGKDLGKLDKLGLGALGAITLGQVMPEEKDESIEEPSYVQTTETLGGDDQFAYSRPQIMYPSAPQKRGELTYDYGSIPFYAATGGTPEFPRENGIGAIEGPGTETSDSIPAMLSDGEFVMNAKAVKGAGYAMGARDDYEARKLGAQKMYETMDQLEAVA